MTVEEFDVPLFDCLDECEQLGFKLTVAGASKNGDRLHVRVHGTTRGHNYAMNEMHVVGLNTDPAAAWRAGVKALYESFDCNYALQQWCRFNNIFCSRESELGQTLIEDFEDYRKYVLVKLVKAFDRMKA